MTVLRGNDWALGPIRVDYATSDLTAKAGQDYQAVSGTLELKENETMTSLTIPILRARPTGGTKSFLVTLSNATGGATLGTSVTTVNIVGGLHHAGSSLRYCAGYPPRFELEHPHLDRGRATPKGGPGERPLANAHGCQQSNHSPVADPGHVLPRHAPKAGERLRPLQLRWPYPHASRAPFAPHPVYFSILLAAYLPIYQLGDTVEELLAEPYRRTLPPLLDGTHDWRLIEAAMPSDPFAMLRPDFQADFRTNVSNPLRQAFLDNNIYSWTPKAPVTMFHCQGDRDVVFANAEVAYQSFTNRGACCVSVVYPGAPAQLNHDDCYAPSLRDVLAWFETLRQ